MHLPSIKTSLLRSLIDLKKRICKHVLMDTRLSMNIYKPIVYKLKSKYEEGGDGVKEKF